MLRAVRVGILAGTALLMVSCGGADSAPSGQVVAKVNGEEITVSELNAELLASGMNVEKNEKEATDAMLTRLIARKLLVQEAKKQGLDENKDFILARQRSEETELAGLAQRTMLENLPRPTREEAAEYIRKNPGIFQGRKLMVLEQIRFAQPENSSDLKFLEAAKTLDEVAALLKQNAIKFERVPSVLDTTSIAPQLASQIDKLPPNEVFVIATGELVLANVIREKRPAAIPQDAALQYASQLIQQERLGKGITDQVDKLKKEAKIVYQDGYGPEAAKAAAAKK
jgi:peptidyl-prolyl cis-trans isomerase C